MIKANELRIGNWFLNPSGTTEQLEGYYNCLINPKISHHWQEEEGYDEGDIQPIPLTPEWLERMGFTKGSKSTRTGEGYYWKISDFEIVEKLPFIKIPGCYWLMGSEWTLGEPIKFVHQLQNLYFALTGVELQIKDIEII